MLTVLHTAISLIAVTSFIQWTDAFNSVAVPGRCRSSSTTTSLGPTARNGLYYEDVTIGSGRRVLPGDTVLCYYIGTFKKNGGGGSGKKSTGNPFLDAITGGGVGSGRGGGAVTVFDQTKEGEPFSFQLGKKQVIQGWDLGVGGNYDLEIPPMNVGGDRKLVIPAALAYGESGVGPIPPNQELEFQIEILAAEQIGGIDINTRLKGYAAVVAFATIVLSLGWFILHNI